MARHHRKRSHHEDEPDQVDDFAVAASFAQVPMYKPKPVVEGTKTEAKALSTAPRGVVDDVESSDSDDDSDDDQDKGVNEGDEAKNTSKEEDESDDESDVDLSEALAKMIDESGPKQQSINKAPTTEHEIDPYKTPIDELQSNFQLNLTVEEEEHLRLAGSADASSKSGGPVQLCPAGHVSCHMVDDRTIVVESSPTLKKGPLDEGSLLVVRVVNESDDNEKMRLLPLGKVFEVFGPISRPLYTIRLPPPPSHPKKKAPPTIKESEMKEVSEQKPGAGDENEISISDDEAEDKEPVAKEEPVAEKEPEVKPLPPDDWAPKGQFTTILAASARQIVYYIEDEAKLLDTFAIMRTSGKGCDASNLYDEEVLTSNDMYFSDDEQEREFKNRGKKKGKNQRRDRPQNSHGQQPIIPGFHAPTQQQQAPQQIPGFHASARPLPPPPPPRQPYPQAMGQQAAPYYPYPQQGIMPPQQNMPYQQYSQQPVPQGYPPQAFQGAPQQQYQYPPQGGAQPYPPAPYPYQQQPYQQQQQQQPYPPPNANSANPPDESDTVYFN
jgi:hypothetical protein